MSSQDKIYLEQEDKEERIKQGLGLKDEVTENSQANDDFSEEPASREMITDGYKAILYCQKSFKYSAIFLCISLLFSFLIWYRLFFDLDVLTTLQAILLFIAVLVQSSIAANTIIAYVSVVLGRLNQTLQLSIDAESSASHIKGQMLFLQALCKGSIGSTTATTLFIPTIVFFAFLSTGYYKPEYSFDLPETLASSILAVFMLTNIASIFVMRKTKRKAEEILKTY